MSNTTMKSLALPLDLYWDVKLESNLDPNYQLLSIFDGLNGSTLNDEDYFLNDLSAMCSEELELKHDDTDFTQALLGDKLVIELYNLKEENFYSPSPLLENALESVITNPAQVIKVQLPVDTNNTGFTNNAASIFTSLTPPSSPPQVVASAIQQKLEITASTSAAAANFAINHSNNGFQNPTTSDHLFTSSIQNQNFSNNWNNLHSPTNIASSIIPSSPTSSSSSSYDMLLNTQIIDDILKIAANEFFEESESQSSVSGPSTVEYTSTDDEWMPLSRSYLPSLITISEKFNKSSGNSSTKNRTRHYGRGADDRKKRKKEQNKNAATRYRQKKKLEMEIIQIEEKKLNQHHEELKRQLKEHEREAKYLRCLLREFYAKQQ